MITTANDSSERDPSAWTLFGRAANGVWSEIDSGLLALPEDRLTDGAEVPVDNTEAYEAYRMTFSDLKGDNPGSMQIGDVQFFGTVVPEPGVSALFATSLAGCLLLRHRFR